MRESSISVNYRHACLKLLWINSLCTPATELSRTKFSWSRIWYFRQFWCFRLDLFERLFCVQVSYWWMPWNPVEECCISGVCALWSCVRLDGVDQRITRFQWEFRSTAKKAKGKVKWSSVLGILSRSTHGETKLTFQVDDISSYEEQSMTMSFTWQRKNGEGLVNVLPCFLEGHVIHSLIISNIMRSGVNEHNNPAI